VVLEGEEDSTAVGAGTASHLSVRDVTGIVVRENIGRDSEDDSLAQMYLTLKSDEAALLVYQANIFEHHRVREMAMSLADRWKVPLVDDLTKVTAHRGPLVDMVRWFTHKISSHKG
jgi:hypothetical protein